MARRYSCKACAVALAGTAHTHGITSGGVAQTPDEWAINLRGPTPAASAIYIQGAPTSTTLTVAASGAAGTCDVFAWYNHSIVE